MSHDLEAAYASSEVADLLTQNQNIFFGGMGNNSPWSIYAMREGSNQWPLADGVLLAENTNHSDIKIAFEYKRPNEGVHGILTALGQSFAYLEKGYNASIMVIPEKYSSHDSPGTHIKKIIDSTAPKIPISIYVYSAPDLSVTHPFRGKLSCVREISLPECININLDNTTSQTSSVSTLWAHVREGMSFPDAFFKYCQAIKIISSYGEHIEDIKIPQDIVNAIKRSNSQTDAYKYLSNTSGETLHDKVWRYVWFNYYFWEDLMPIYNKTTSYIVNNIPTKIIQDETGIFQGLFSSRNNSIKCTLVEKLNNGLISEIEAYNNYVKKVRDTAHSYREVIDSGLEHIGFIASDGSLTELGYKYVEACERYASAYSEIPMEILRASVLQNGKFGAMLHYIYKLSEEKFNNDLFAFTNIDGHGNYIFNQNDYLSWLREEFTNSLHLIKTTTLRADGSRKPFQAELAFLKKLGFINLQGRSALYRVGSGLSINWPQVQNSMMYFNSL